CKKPKTQFVFENRGLIKSHQRRYRFQKRLQISAVHVARHTRDVRHVCKIQLRAFRRLHIQPFGLIENRAADSVPVKPTAEVLFRQSVARNNMMNHQVGRVETLYVCITRALNPLSDFLTKQRACFATDRVVPKSRALESLTAEDHVYAEDHVVAERN